MDKGTCPHCKKEFTITAYGYRIPCPYCKKPINIYPDPKEYGDLSYSIHLFCQDAQFQGKVKNG